MSQKQRPPVGNQGGAGDGANVNNSLTRRHRLHLLPVTGPVEYDGNETAQQEANLALRCAELRMEAARLNAQHLGNAYAGHLAAQLRDFANLLETAEHKGLFGYQPNNYGPEVTP
jgi:hypothetical protein